MENQRNLILAVVLCALLLFGWDSAISYFYPHANKPVVAVRLSVNIRWAITSVAWPDDSKINLPTPA